MFSCLCCRRNRNHNCREICVYNIYICVYSNLRTSAPHVRKLYSCPFHTPHPSPFLFGSQAVVGATFVNFIRPSCLHAAFMGPCAFMLLFIMSAGPRTSTPRDLGTLGVAPRGCTWDPWIPLLQRAASSTHDEIATFTHMCIVTCVMVCAGAVVTLV